MCGIAGILSSPPASLHAIEAMTRVQAHRGPDGEGFAFVAADGALELSSGINGLTESRLALGHRRLAILDTSEAGLQPMASADGRYAICYNGEVYNYLELRKELEAAGHSFHTGTDTEVVLAAYQAWGTACFSRFNGMWAIAIWDGAQNKLVLSRDRFGVKPLHFARHNGAFYFSSEIKGLLASGVFPRKLNRARAADFLRWGTVNHTGETLFQGINVFPPGHFAVIDMENPAALSPQPYWQPPATERLGARTLDLADAEREFREIFDSAVSLRLRSDVPVGACLSGGLDSSAIVCTVADGLSPGHRLATFTSASPNPAFDERRWSDLVVRQCGTETHTVFPSAEGFKADLDAFLHTQEEPVPLASVYAQYLLMKAAREASIPVLLDGQGADEALCGYRKYVVYSLLEAAQTGRWLDLLSGLGWWAAQGDKGLLKLSEGVRYLPGFLRRGAADPVSDIVLPSFAAEWAASQPGSGLKSYRSSERQLDDLLRFSVPPLLRYEDRNSMAWSIESRVPFLDYRLVEFMLELPTSLKVSRSRTKALMRSALRGRVPDAILDRRDKMGFVTPQHLWMKGPLKQYFAETLAAPDFPLGDLVDGKRAAQLLDAEGYWQGASLNAAFRIFMLARWAQLYEVTI